MVSLLFRDFLFYSYFNGLFENSNEKKAVEPLRQSHSRIGSRNKNLVLYSKSRQDAFDLIADIVGGDVDELKKFLAD